MAYGLPLCEVAAAYAFRFLEEAAMVATTQNEFGTTPSATYARRLEGVVETKRISWSAVIAGIMIA